MSPNVGNFVHDLVEMAKAMETLPIIQHELDQAKSALIREQTHNEGLELNIIGYKQQIDDLHAKVRSLEVERDDASFRVLEAEDLVASVLNSARVAQAGMEAMISKLDPPKPEPEKEPEPQGSSEVNPTIHGSVALSSSQDQTSASNTVTQSESASTSTTIPDWQQDKAETSLLPPGQSENSPTATTMKEEQTGSVVGSVTQEGVASLPEPTHSPYFGKRYHEMPQYIQYNDWIAGGGTDDGYFPNRF